MLKRVALLFLCLILTVSVFGCAASDSDFTDGGAAPIVPEDTTEPPEIEDGVTDGSNGDATDEPPDNAVPDEPKEEDPEENVPAPAIKYDTLVVSLAESLTVRSGRGSSYTALGSLDKNDMLNYVDLKNGWFAVQYKNKVSYVSAAYSKTAALVASDNAKIEKVIDQGKSLMGLPYVWGAERYHWGNGVRNTAFNGKSFDCSSLMQYIFKIGANINLATTSRNQSVQGTYVKKENIKRGDLMFFTNDSRYYYSGTERIGHVALYLGNNYILHTASDHAVIEPISAKRWSYYITSRRMI